MSRGYVKMRLLRRPCKKMQIRMEPVRGFMAGWGFLLYTKDSGSHQRPKQRSS